MAKLKYFCILFFCVFLNVIISDNIFQGKIIKNADEISIYDSQFRAMDLSRIDLAYINDLCDTYRIEIGDLIILSICDNYRFDNKVHWDNNELIKKRNRLIKNSSEYFDIKNYIEHILLDLEYFPVAKSTNNLPFVDYDNSWNFERTFGGKRGHEGCDIMAKVNERGVYPIVSATSGVIENIGWLSKGGYRVGIKSDNGVYYYYAHLAEYADINIGDRVNAGDLLGFMGDTGYSDVEGTVGNFDVHLHFGIYIYDKNGNEVSLNPYYFLRRIENKVLYFDYGM